jgi:hypothetical protein
MIEVFGRPDDIAVWHAPSMGSSPTEQLPSSTRDGRLAGLRVLARDKRGLMRSCCSRRDPRGWWKSASNTIFETPTDL